MIRLETDKGILLLYAVSSNIIRCVYTKEDATELKSPLDIRVKAESCFEVREERSCVEKDPEQEKRSLLVCVTGDGSGFRLCLRIDAGTGRFTWCEDNGKNLRLLLQEGDKELTPTPLIEWTTGGEEPVYRMVHTVDGDRSFVENLHPEETGTAFRAKLRFLWQDGEQIHGLGQGEEGIYNYRGKTQYLYQHNMRIPMPWILSDRGYAILADCGSLMTFNDDERGSYLFMETVEQLDYYFICGRNADELIRGYRFLTGRASMLPKWAFGYVQSKERYETQEELVGIAREYRRRGIGLDCVVQDWKTWTGDHWGEKTAIDRERFPDLKRMRDQLHELHVHSMVSIWPNMNYNTADHEQMKSADPGFLLHDLTTYDAFNPAARALYWEQAYQGLYKDGFDSWWCDSTEPFPGPDWGGETMREPWERFRLVGDEHKKYLGPLKTNLYAKAHAKGMFENQRKADPDHRVLNLTRSGYAGIQRYGAMLWSGDTSATWETLRTQITEGLNMALSGIPYWTLDIGGFFVVKDNWKARGCGCEDDPTPKWFWHGAFENGLSDPGFRELYVRWLQLGVFLPMFRSHGTDVPREIWQFGEPGETFYDAIADAIALRYRLMPYIYSLAGAVCREHDTMMRPLLFDFPEDPEAAANHQAFMFGRSLLVCPVTEPVMHLPGGRAVCEKKTANRTGPVWECYLPGGTAWYDFQTGEKYEGGQTIKAEAGLAHIPLFVRAGSIIPMEKKLTYAAEAVSTPLEICVYPGADSCFTWYEDAGDGYGYEEGEYNLIRMNWNDSERTLTIGEAGHSFHGGLTGRICKLTCEGTEKIFVYNGNAVQITL